MTVWFTVHTPEAVQMAVGRGGGGGQVMPPVVVVEVEVEVEVVVTAMEINPSQTASSHCCQTGARMEEVHMAAFNLKERRRRSTWCREIPWNKLGWHL